MVVVVVVVLRNTHSIRVKVFLTQAEAPAGIALWVVDNYIFYPSISPTHTHISHKGVKEGGRKCFI